MSFSLNEVEGLAKKATRGAGYPWGLAEEAAKAVRWLAARGVDGCIDLAVVLEQCDGVGNDRLSPDTEGEPWAAADGVLCPIITGAAIADRSAALRTGECRLAQTLNPVLLIPFAALAARDIGVAVTVSCEGMEAVTDGQLMCLDGEAPARAGVVTIRQGGRMDHPRPACTRLTPDAASWRRLNDFAHRTYAPATEESRLRGAGAGVSDND